MGDEVGCFFLSSSRTVLLPTAALRGRKSPLELEESNQRAALTFPWKLARQTHEQYLVMDEPRKMVDVAG